MNGFLDLIETGRLTMSDDDLNKAAFLINEERKLRQKRAVKVNKRSMKAGDEVSFYNTREQKRMTGEITKVKVKKALVRVGNVSWDVPLSLLSAA